jgi:hypothetical protein
MGAGAKNHPTGSEKWLEASVVWIDAKSDCGGREIREVIYEVRGDPDNLRQIDLPADALYQNAKRGDRVLIQPETSSIRRDVPQPVENAASGDPL